MQQRALNSNYSKLQISRRRLHVTQETQKKKSAAFSRLAETPHLPSCPSCTLYLERFRSSTLIAGSLYSYLARPSILATKVRIQYEPTREQSNKANKKRKKKNCKVVASTVQVQQTSSQQPPLQYLPSDQCASKRSFHRLWAHLATWTDRILTLDDP